MDELAKSDIFFVLTGGAVVLVTLLVLVILYYIIKILRDVEDITDNVREETEEVVSDIHNARTHIKKNVKKGGRKLKDIISSTSKKKSKK